MPEVKKKASYWIWIVVAVAVIFFLITVGIAIVMYFQGDGSYSSSKSVAPESTMYDESYPTSKDSSGIYTDSAISQDVENVDASVLTAGEQKVIKTGNLELVVNSVSEVADNISKLATTNEGFVQSSDVRTSEDGTQYATVVIKVPANKFEQALRDVKNLALRVESEKSSGQDVTEEFVDLQSQLKNLRAQEEQYLSILTKAEKIDDILQVTKQLNNTRLSIETIEGRIKYLENLTDLSTITAYLTQEVKVDLPTKDWKPLTNLKTAFRAWVQVIQWFADAIVWVILFMGPPALVIWLIVWLIIRRVRRNKQV